MKRTSRWTGALWLGVTLLLGAGAAAAWAAPQQQPARGGEAGLHLAEYNAYQAAHNEQNVAQRMKLLDDFVMKYPMSALLPYVYRDYYLGYYGAKDYPKAIDYADKEWRWATKSTSAPAGSLHRVGAGLLHRPGGQGLADSRDAHQDQGRCRGRPEDPGRLAEARQDDRRPVRQAEDQHRHAIQSVAGMAESGLKDYKSAEASYKAALALDPSDAVTHFRLGVADLQDMPPQRPMDSGNCRARSL